MFGALLIGCMLPVVSLLIVFVHTAMWTALVFELGHELGRYPGGFIIGGVGAMIAFGIHLGGLTGLVESAP